MSRPGSGGRGGGRGGGRDGGRGGGRDGGRGGGRDGGRGGGRDGGRGGGRDGGRGGGRDGGRSGGRRRGGVPAQQLPVPQPSAGGRGRGSSPAQRDLASSSSAPPPPAPEGLAGDVEKKLVLHSPAPASSSAPQRGLASSPPAPPPPAPEGLAGDVDVEKKLVLHSPAPASSSAAQRDLASSSSAPPPPAPEGLAGDVEKKLVLHSTGPASSSNVSRPPRRPGYGVAGSKCVVRANHYPVKVSLAKSICHYDVSVSPEVPSRNLGRGIMKELVEVSGAAYMGGRKPVYDGRKSLYTAGPLPFESKDFQVCLVDRDENTGEVRRERVFKVTIKLASMPDLHHLMLFLSGKNFDMPYETVQALDLVMREKLTADYTPVGRSYFSKNFGEGASPIGEGLECWRGFYQSIRPAQMGLSLNIDVAATAFYEPANVIDFVAQLLNGLDPRQPMKDHERVKVKKALRGLRVTTNHSGGRRKYKISDISSLPLKQLKFPVDENGTMSTIIEYFNGRYKYELRHLNWPCLQVGSDRKPTYLPMEVCKIADKQHFSNKLNERQVSNILKIACQRPNIRERNIDQVVSLNNYTANEYAVEFGITVGSQMASLEARVLPPPELQYGAGPNSSCRPSVGVWNMINRKMINGSEIKSWTCVCFSQTVQRSVDEFIHELVRKCNNMGMQMHQQPCIPFSFGRPDEIGRILRRIREHSSGKLQLLIIILPERSGQYYGLIKRMCETELDIVSQCCLPKHLRKISKQYLENVALKINVKAGGRNTALIDAVQRRIPLLTDYPTIIFGADVTHPAPGEDTSPSIAAVVASMDWPLVTKYRCLLSAQKHRREIIDDLYTYIHDKHGGLIRDHLIAFHRMTGQKPHRIIFYRDGVSEGQFSQVLFNEVDAIHRACQSLESNYLPPVTFIVVQKRHHTRLFPADRRFTDLSGNIVPGTIVDKVICHPTEFDFYLCSHAGIQGTSRPTHYHVLHDENKFTADGLQALTNNLCYTYARCTRSVSIVPPAYYAHLGAARARYYIEGDTFDVGTSSGSASRAPTRGGDVRPLPQVKENVRAVMFYC